MSSNNTIPSAANPPDPVFPFTQPANTTTSSPSPPSPIEPSSTPPFPAARASDRGLAPGVLAGLITGAVLGATFVLIGVCVFVCFYKRKKRKLQRRRDAEAAINGDSPLPSLSDPKLVLTDGTEVAIKQLKAGSGQGEREFQAEIQTISRVHHRHLVSLLGYCITGSQRLLVYEFVPNKTLEFHLHEKGRPVMEWGKRMKIALGAAKGLSYLHEDCNPKTIHRDVKAANILIDDSYEAKLADFGLARSSLDTDTHVSTRIMGTFGYLAPEYASSGKLTDKSDVFSFGVVLLELITGRRPVDKSQPFVDDDSIVDWAKPLMIQALNDSNFDGLVDPRLEGNFDISEMTRVVACAAASVRHSAKRRPKMSQIVRAFEGNLSLDDLTEGVTPGHSTIYSLDGSSDYSSTQYKEDLKKFKKMALESQTFGSSECSGLTTSDNGQNPSGSSSITEGLRTTQEIEPEKKTDRTIS
ncbi:hypothetical protein Bca4012_008115 [Brassica carinata]